MRLLFYMLLLFALQQNLHAQCTSCTYTATTSGASFNLTGNQRLCITANVSNLNININGTGNDICVASGVTWTQDFLTLQNGCTVNVYGTLDNSQQSWSNISINGGTACIINVQTGGTILTATGGLGNNLTINNSGTLNFTNTGGIGNSGSFILTNNAGATVNALSTTNFQIGNNVNVHNYGTMNLANAENSEGYMYLYNGSLLKVSREYNNHGAFIIEPTGQFELPCETLPGAAGMTTCSFRVGDKGVGKEFINNSDCFEVNGNVNFEGATTNNGIIVLTSGNLSISKPSTGTGGHIVVQNGTSTIQNSGSYAGTNLTFCDVNTAGNDFDNIFNTPSSNLYTVDCSVTTSSCGGATCTEPSAITLSKTAATCTGGTSNNNGTITLVSATNADKWGISTLNAASYDGNNYASATAYAANSVVKTNVPNTGGTYILRLFNGADDCYQDTTIMVATVVCETCTGNATAVTSQTGVTNPTNATGAANSTNALMYDNADVIVLDLGVYLEAGATYTIRWKNNSGGTNPAMLVEEGYNSTTFTANGAATTVSSTTYITTNKTVGIPLMRYVRITSQNAGDLDLDAVTFTNAACSNCSVTVTSAVPTSCSDTEYDLAVTVTYSDPPTGNIVLAIGDGVGTLFTFTPDGTSPDTYTINNLTASNVQDIDVRAYFVNHPACTHTLSNAFDAPATCGTYCSGNLLLNPSFEITSTNVTPPPVNTFYTPASWVAPLRCYADLDWLRPDGIGHLGLYGTGTSVAYQNVPVTVGNAYTLTLYSAMHFPLTNVGSAKIQYYTAANVPIGVGNVHYVTHNWEDDHGFGGPYTLFLDAAPANASYVRVTLENHNPTAAGESVKFDALCLTTPDCVVAATLTQTAPTCTGGAADDNGFITLTAISNANRFGISTGATYSGTPNYAAATAIGPLPQNLQTNIPNSGGTYTIRFFNGSDGCYRDTTVVQNGMNCFTDCIHVRDNFSMQAYNNQDGATNWSSNWVEINDDGSPATGEIFIPNTPVYLSFDNDNNTNPEITRSVNLLGAHTASMSVYVNWGAGAFDVGDVFRIQISGNGGSTYTTLQTFTGADPLAMSTGSRDAIYSYDITPYIAGNVVVRMGIVSGFTGANEFMQIENISIDACVLGAIVTDIQPTYTEGCNPGEGTGSITVLGYSGESPYLYSIDGVTFQSSQTFSGLPSGNYTLTVRDNQNRTATTTATVSAYPIGTDYCSEGPSISVSGATNTVTTNYKIDFAQDVPVITSVSPQLATVTGNVLNAATNADAGFDYTITATVSGGPNSGNSPVNFSYDEVIASSVVLGASELDGAPSVVTSGSDTYLRLALEGSTVSSSVRTYYRDPSTKMEVAMSLSNSFCFNNPTFSLGDMDYSFINTNVASEDFGSGEFNNYNQRFSYIDRITMLTGIGTNVYTGSGSNVNIVGDVATGAYTDANNNLYPDVADDGRVITTDPAGYFQVNNPGSLKELRYIYHDPGYGIEGDPDGLHDFDADNQLHTLNSNITFSQTSYQLCAGSDITLTANAAGLSNIIWYNSADVQVGTGTTLMVNTSTAGMEDNMDSFYFTGTDSDGCLQTYCCPVPVSVVPLPVVTFSQTPATCSAATPNNDGILQLTAATNGDRFGISTLNAGTYDGSDYASATAISVPDTILNNIPNTGGTYIVRIFNGADDCFKDTTITVAEVCCIGVNMAQICQQNGTPTNPADDYFTLEVLATATGAGASNQYQVVLGANPDGTGGTVLGTQTYGTAITVGNGVNGATGTFVADGSTTYNITVRDADGAACAEMLTTSPVNECAYACDPQCLLDWDNNAWASGSMSNTYTVSGTTVTIDFDDASGSLSTAPPVNMPVAAPFYQGDQPGVGASLLSSVDLIDFGTANTLDIGMSLGYPGLGVDDLNFKIFDVDGEINALFRQERFVITGYLNGVAVNPVLTGSFVHTISGNEVLGWTPTSPTGGNSADGVVSVYFADAVDSVAVIFSINPGSVVHPTSKPGFGIFDLAFCANPFVEEPAIAIATDSICSGDDPGVISLTTTLEGSGPISYQWQSSTAGCGSGFADIAGATGTTYDPPAGLTATTYYRLMASTSSAACAAAVADTSNCVTVTVLPLPDFTLGLATVCPGEAPEVTIGGLTGGTAASSTMKINTGSFVPYVASPPNLTTAQGIVPDITNTVRVHNEHGCEAEKDIDVPNTIPMGCPPVILTRVPAGSN